jgi:type IV pilus assembly protein PilA
MFKSIKKRLKNQRGLTLVELLAVVVILGIIAAIAVPNIGKLIEKTKDDAKVAEGLQIINAAKLYTNTNKLTFDSQTVTAKDTATITAAQLADNLDNVKDQGTSGPDYEVKVVKKSTGKYEYFLDNHDSEGLVDKDLNKDGTNGAKVIDGLASEKELLDY